MSNKSGTQPLLKSFFLFVRTQFNVNIKIICTDNGSEFLSMKDFFLNNRVEFQRSCMYTPQQNGVVERKHRHILNIARALRFQYNLPLSFWGECVLTAVYLINRLPTPLLNQKSLFELLYNKLPTYFHLRVFGCLCYATIVHPHNKFDSCAHHCVFLGYPTGKKGYKLYDLDSHHFLVSRDVTFHETNFPYAAKHSLPLKHPVLPLPFDPPHPDPFPISSHSDPLSLSEPNTRAYTPHPHESSSFDLTPSSPSSPAPAPVPTQQFT
jgi:hypothetical protein